MKMVSEQAIDLCKKFILTDPQFEEIKNRLRREIMLGLGKASHSKADVKCFVTYVQELPTGTEEGKFLALDLGGTNFRVLLIRLNLGTNFEMESKIYALPHEIMVGTGYKLFDHIAECIADFIKEQNLTDEILPLAFTFSFPVIQIGLGKGILAKWTKGFYCKGVVGEDVVQLLRDAIARIGGCKVNVVAILNDTTGTLMSCAWKNPTCRIGLIIGTGTNACYMEKVKNAENFFVPDNKHENVIINTEWGAFGDNGALDFIRTEFDKEIDLNSMNPGKQIHEKMISGMYLGELVRLILVRLTANGFIFNGQETEQLYTNRIFSTEDISAIESDTGDDSTNCRKVLEKFNIIDPADEECATVRYICECVSTRSAHLTATSIAYLINKINEPFVTVGIDGSVYKCHPKYHERMMAKLRKLVDPNINFDIMLSEDGSGRGAALVAATLTHSPLR